MKKQNALYPFDVIAKANKVIVLENGRVAESGDPDTLKAQHGIFAKMIERQRVVD